MAWRPNGSSILRRSWRMYTSTMLGSPSKAKSHTWSRISVFDSASPPAAAGTPAARTAGATGRSAYRGGDGNGSADPASGSATTAADGGNGADEPTPQPTVPDDQRVDLDEPRFSNPTE